MPPAPVPLEPIRDHSFEEDAVEDGEDGTLLQKAGQRGRADSIPFEFTSSLQLPQSNIEARTMPSGEIGVVRGISLVLGLIIGSGIFVSASIVLREVGSVGGTLVVFLLAGVLNYAGAACFSELGCMIEGNGGSQVYLQAAYGNAAASSFSMASIFILKPSSLGIISSISSEYLTRLLYNTAFSAAPDAAQHAIPKLAIKLVSLLSFTVVFALQAISPRLGISIQLVLTLFKIAALLLVFVGGVVQLGVKGHSAMPFNFESSRPVAGYALALFAASWCFDGWDNANYLTRELKRGALPRIINYSMLTAIMLYLLTNSAFFLVVPYALAIGNPIGLEFGRLLVGPVGGIIMALTVVISCLGAVNSSLYTSARLVVASAEQGFLPEAFASTTRTGTPLNGMLLTFGLTAFFILIGDFSRLTVFYGVTAWTFNILVVVGLLLLRLREPHLKRPYRTWLVAPVSFISFGFFLLVISGATKRGESLAAFVLIAVCGIPWLIQNRGRTDEPPPLRMRELHEEQAEEES